jgi:thiosulfate dehydrogenase
MNCSNYHLDAGTNPGVIITVQCFYISKMRGRSTNWRERINDCFERSLNGSALNEEDKEMKAICLYWIYWQRCSKGEDANSSEFMI